MRPPPLVTASPIAWRSVACAIACRTRTSATAAGFAYSGRIWKCAARMVTGLRTTVPLLVGRHCSSTAAAC